MTAPGRSLPIADRGKLAGGLRPTIESVADENTEFSCLLRRCATDISVSSARAGPLGATFPKNRLKFNDPFFSNGDTRQVDSPSGPFSRYQCWRFARPKAIQAIARFGYRPKRRLSQLSVVGRDDDSKPVHRIVVQAPFTRVAPPVKRCRNVGLGLPHLLERRFAITGFREKPGKDHGLCERLRCMNIALPPSHRIKRDMYAQREIVAGRERHGQQQGAVFSCSCSLWALPERDWFCHRSIAVVVACGDRAGYIGGRRRFIKSVRGPAAGEPARTLRHSVLPAGSCQATCRGWRRGRGRNRVQSRPSAAPWRAPKRD
jgi:hypothetical protein